MPKFEKIIKENKKEEQESQPMSPVNQQRGAYNEIFLAKEIKKRLDTEIQEIMIRRDNLESQIHSLEVQKESKQRFEKSDYERKYEEHRMEIDKIKDSLFVKENHLELMERQFETREKEIEKQEAEAGKIFQQKEELNKEKTNFYKYQQMVKADLENAQNVIAEAQGIMASVQAEKDKVKGERASLEALLKQIDFERGDLNRIKTELEIIHSFKYGIKEDQKEEVHV